VRERECASRRVGGIVEVSSGVLSKADSELYKKRHGKHRDARRVGDRLRADG
jgi:hypothetical protein